MLLHYFAYGSNMNTSRVLERGLEFVAVSGARLDGVALRFDKGSVKHPGVGHASLAYAPGAAVEGVLYELAEPREILKMDRFESTPVNYSREVVQVVTDAGLAVCWTYFANPGVLQPGLKPPRSYLDHLLAGEPYLSRDYFARLAGWPCVENR